MSLPKSIAIAPPLAMMTASGGEAETRTLLARLGTSIEYHDLHEVLFLSRRDLVSGGRSRGRDVYGNRSRDSTHSRRGCENAGFGLSKAEAARLVQAACDRVFEKRSRGPQTALDLALDALPDGFRNPENLAALCDPVPGRFLTLGSGSLDAALGGGIYVRGITEIVGESSAGKTQLCLQLLLHAQRAASDGGLGGKAIYIYTEGEAPLRRLKQMSEVFAARYGLDGAALFESIYVEMVHSVDELSLVLQNHLPRLLREGRDAGAGAGSVRLVVIDSIAGVFRSEFTSAADQLIQRSARLYETASHLKALSDEFRVPIVLSNQVADVFDDSSGGGDDGAGAGPNLVGSDGRRLRAALGMAWSNCVTTRLYLTRLRSGAGGAGGGATAGGSLRRLQVAFSPVVASASASTSIGSALCRIGAVGLEGAEDEGEGRDAL